jgi:NACHT-associated inactive restriction endonuclease
MNPEGECVPEPSIPEWCVTSSSVYSSAINCIPIVRGPSTGKYATACIICSPLTQLIEEAPTSDIRYFQAGKGADKGIDGRLYFHDEPKATKQIIFSVKAGHTSVAHVRDLRGVIEREKAAIGVLITMEKPTQAMRSEATSAGFYQAPFGGEKKYPRLQLFTIEELLDGKTVDFPRENVTFKKAPGHRPIKETQIPLAPESN